MALPHVTADVFEGMLGVLQRQTKLPDEWITHLARHNPNLLRFALNMEAVRGSGAGVAVIMTCQAFRIQDEANELTNAGR